MTITSVGFTGTRASHQITDERLLALRGWLLELKKHGASDFHHGDCTGMDAIAAAFADRLGYRLTAHPSTNEAARANTRADVRHEPKPALERNWDIVRASDLVLAVPVDPEHEVLRSGTWATVRYARTADRKVVLL